MCSESYAGGSSAVTVVTPKTCPEPGMEFSGVAGRLLGADA